MAPGTELGSPYTPPRGSPRLSSTGTPTWPAPTHNGSSLHAGGWAVPLPPSFSNTSKHGYWRRLPRSPRGWVKTKHRRAPRPRRASRPTGGSAQRAQNPSAPTTGIAATAPACREPGWRDPVPLSCLLVVLCDSCRILVMAAIVARGAGAVTACRRAPLAPRVVLDEVQDAARRVAGAQGDASLTGQ